MIEKRKKLTSHGDEEAYHVDVEEYETKKTSFRHKWGYFAVIALILVVVFLQLPSTRSSTTPKKPSSFTEPTLKRNTTSALPLATKSGYTIKVASLSSVQATNLETTPVKATSAPVAQVQSPPAVAAVAVVQPNLRTEVSAVTSASAELTEAELQAKVDAQIAKVRHMKFDEHIVMENSPVAKAEIAVLQDLLKKLLRMQYGKGPLRVEMKLQFPQSMSQPVLPQEQTIMIDLAPIDLVPYSVYNFLQIVKHWKGGAFMRNAGHVLQATANTDVPIKGMAFQEYHPDFPHKQYTMGFAGRPSGPQFYISTVNNVQNHGPGSQGSKTEADACFGKVQAQSIDVVKRMQTQPGASKPMGFVNNKENHIKIVSMKIISQRS